MPENSSRRRWYQFSLRGLFVAVTLLALVLAWVGYSLDWIRQRRDFTSRHMANSDAIWLDNAIWPGERLYKPRAPSGLWLFGEKGFTEVWVEPWEEESRTQELFPEALILTR